MKANTSFNPTPANLRKAAELAESIENMQNELNALLSGSTVTATPAPAKGAKRGRGKFTPAQRARISAGLKAKWAERHAAKLAATSVTPVAGGVTIDQTIPAGAEAVKMVKP